MGYVIGSDPGAFHIARQAGGPEAAMQLAGLYRKAMAVVRHGVNFVQLPLENISEFQEPDLENNMRKVKEMGIGFGIHGETSALGSEGAQMDSALKDNYIRAHQKVEIMITESGKLGSKYLLLHSSESPGFLQLGMALQPTTIVDFWGRNFSDFLEDKSPKMTEAIKWAIKKPEVMGIAGHRFIRNPNFDNHVKELEDELKESWKVNPEVLRRYPRIAAEVDKRVAKATDDLRRSTNNPNAKLTPDVMEKIVDGVIDEKVPENAEEDFTEALKNFSRTADLTYSCERVAYYVVAKWMEVNNDPLWDRIVNSSIDYYAALAKKERDEWLKDNQIKSLSMNDPQFFAKHTLWFPAVSAKYIWGHFSQERNPGPSKDPRIHDLKGMIRRYSMPFVIETPMVSEEEMSRLPSPLQMYYVMKTLDESAEGMFGVAFDIEHILMANINPEVAFNLLPEEGGRNVLVIHTGWPSPLGPAHLPIPLGSEQQAYLYRLYYILRNKGMGKEKDVYIIFERGGGDDPYKQSYLALRNIIDFLQRDVPPDQLPTEFYGIESKQILSVEKQLVAIREHALDPIKGLITVPEEEHGVLGKAALEKGKRPEEWAKERYR